MDHQDWKPVVWTKKVEVKKSPRSKRDSTSDHLRKLDEEDEKFSHPTVSRTVSQAIQQGRMGLKLKQKDLAQRLNVKPDVVVQYESGKSIPSNQLLQKMERILKVKLTGKNIGEPLPVRPPKK